MRIYTHDNDDYYDDDNRKCLFFLRYIYISNYYNLIQE